MENPQKSKPGITAGMGARPAQALEACILLQVVCSFLALFMSTRNQAASVVLSAVACSLIVPTLGIIATSLMGVEDSGQDGRIGATEAIAEIIVAILVSCVCLFSFIPRTGRFSEKNPYSNQETLQCIVEFVVGEQFVVPGSIQSDGLIMKVPEGKEVVPPTVFPKPGLTFIGWRYAGTGDPDIAVGTPIYLDANGTKNNSVILYAEYVDSEGTTYCACGAMGEREFAGTSWQGMNTRIFAKAFVPMAIAFLIGGVIIARRKRVEANAPQDGETEQGSPEAESADAESQSQSDAAEEESADDSATADATEDGREDKVAEAGEENSVVTEDDGEEEASEAEDDNPIEPSDSQPDTKAEAPDDALPPADAIDANENGMANDLGDGDSIASEEESLEDDSVAG